ncbi:uncharacterized protein B0T15DRAFT_26176 [Chaetomium strumarium]|uniref:Uncharacterized protein n=1 Tax=Chaetomium strumarium TaxID=1170767 RepID=A0AAJ0M600_9PEZI|nr:hypothetical protein B0T15DRAFT_26176 [Chaetomium strumarium]
MTLSASAASAGPEDPTRACRRSSTEDQWKARFWEFVAVQILWRFPGEQRQVVALERSRFLLQQERLTRWLADLKIRGRQVFSAVGRFLNGNSGDRQGSIVGAFEWSAQARIEFNFQFRCRGSEKEAASEISTDDPGARGLWRWQSRCDRERFRSSSLTSAPGSRQAHKLKTSKAEKMVVLYLFQVLGEVLGQELSNAEVSTGSIEYGAS